MDEKPKMSVEELEGIKEYFNQKGSDMEEMLEEYQMCITSLLENGIPAGEVHDAMEIFLESTKLLNHKFQMLSTTAQEVVTGMQNVVNESDNAILY